MTDIPIHESRQDRYGKTDKKTLTLTTEAIEAIQAYADRHSLYFSVAIESLALMALGQTAAESLPRLVTNLIERMLSRYFNRFAKLLSLTAITAEEANYKTDILLLQTIWHEARQDPDNFVEKMQVSDQLGAWPDAQARQIRDEIIDDARRAALTRLKKPLSENSRLLEKEVADEA